MKKIMVCGVAKGSLKTSIVLRVLILVVALPLLASGCGNSYMTKTERITKPDQGKAMVNFVRPPNFMGFENDYPIWDGNNFVGFLVNGKYIQYQTTPGEHYFLIMEDGWMFEYPVSYLKANLAPDKQYVIDVHLGISQAHRMLYTGGLLIITPGSVLVQRPVTEADYKNGQIKDVTKWLTTLEPTTPIPQRLESYLKSRRAEVIESISQYNKPENVHLVTILAPQDFLPESPDFSGAEAK